MEFKEFTAAKDDSERRLDRVIRKFIPEQNLSSIYKTIRKGLIKLNDKKAKPESKVYENDVIKVASFLLSEKHEQSDSGKTDSYIDNQKLKIVFQNEDIIIFDKPYDIVVHGERNSFAGHVETLLSKTIQKTSLSFRPGPLHRLDRKTTGLIAFSKSLDGAKWFSEHISDHSISKNYISIIQGKLEEKETWIDYIEKIDDDNVSFHTVKAVNSKENTNQKAKKAVTEVEPVSFGKYNGTDITFVKINIKTGRTHQIRAQASLHSHPLLGDTAYGGKKINSTRDFYLHAYRLIFPKNNPLEIPENIQSEIPDDFIKILSSSNCEILPTVL